MGAGFGLQTRPFTTSLTALTILLTAAGATIALAQDEALVGLLAPSPVRIGSS